MIALSSGTFEAVVGKVVRFLVEGGGMIDHKHRPELDPRAGMQRLLDAVIRVTGHRFHSLEAALDVVLPLLTTQVAHSAMVLTCTQEAATSCMTLGGKQELTVLRVSGSLSRILVPGERYALSQTYCTSIVAEREALVLVDMAMHPQYQHVYWTQQLGCRSFIGVPLVFSDNYCYGVLCVLDLFPAWQSQTSQVVQALKSLASVLCALLEQETLRTRLVELEQQHAQRQAEARSYHQQLERERLVRERAETQTRVQQAAVQERERLARELHDSVLQALFGISLEAQLAEEEGEMDQERWRAVLERIIALAEGGQAEIRALLFELRPESMESEGLIGALLKQVAILRTSYALVVETELGEGKEPALSLESKHALYRITQEAFHNIVKHARASRVILRLDSDEQEVVLVIQDNGRGFEPRASFPGHLGLRSMRERVASLQGNILIESSPGQGTTLTIRVPAQKLS